MSALRWPAYTDDEIAKALRLALACSPLVQPPEANWRCCEEHAGEPGAGEIAKVRGVTCLGDERDRAGAP
jgi:hypothetical protein